MKKFGDCANVYTLSDEFQNVFYVGCTSLPMEKRLSTHISNAKYGRGNKAKNEKISSLGYKVFINSVEFITTKRMKRYQIQRVTKETELIWIYVFHKRGFQLTNGKELQSAIRMYS